MSNPLQVRIEESFPNLGPFDKARNTPTVLFDPLQLVESVAILWEAMKGQKGFMEELESDLSRRRTEMEVRLKKMEGDVNNKISEEALRREKDDDKIRDEIQRLRDEMHTTLAREREEAQEREEALKREVERTTATLKVSVAQTQDDVQQLKNEVAMLKDAINALKGSGEGILPLIERLQKLVDEKHSAICRFVGTTPAGVEKAVAAAAEKDAFLATPALSYLNGKIKAVDALADATSKDVVAVRANLQATDTTVAATKADVVSVKDSLRDTEVRIIDGYMEGDKKLSRRIDDLLSKLNAIAASGSGGSVPTMVDSSPAIDALREEVDALQSRVRTLEQDMPLKASKTDLIAKADADVVHGIQSDVEYLKAQLNALHKLIEELQGRPVPIVERAHPPTAPEIIRERVIETKPDPRLDQLQGLLDRLGDAESQCRHLEEFKADKEDVENSLRNLMRKIERLLNDILARLQQLEDHGRDTRDSTAGRFRCLSCNANAGPLSENVSERISGGQFPPSHLYVQASKINPPSGGSQHRPGSAPSVPGMKTYGGGLTTSRRKLMNYYSWLQDKSQGDGGQYQDAEASTTPRGGYSSRPPSAGSKRPWDGAQSGGGEPGDRQSGDHGSEDPEAIGSDGKYYIGVKTSGKRPQSATNRAGTRMQ